MGSTTPAIGSKTTVWPPKPPRVVRAPRAMLLGTLTCGLLLGCSDPVQPFDGYDFQQVTGGGGGVAATSSGPTTSTVASSGGASTSASVASVGAGSDSTSSVATSGLASTTGAATTSVAQTSATTGESSTSASTTGGVNLASSTTSAVTSGFGSATTDAGAATTGSSTTGGDASSSAGGATSTDTAGSTGASVPATFAEIETYLTGYCATSTACHGNGAREVVLTGAATYDTLMSLTVSRCTNQPMVSPGDPAGSALYNVLTGGCSNFRMPPSCPSNQCTGLENIQMIESWILAGAPSN